ncbi:MAG: prepilin-type N-terminal cleavage/methylation domain-containing protein [Actinomycetota bacterium]
MAERTCRDRGSTLVEMVVATALVGIVMSALAVSARTVFIADDVSHARLNVTQQSVIGRLQTTTTSPTTTTAPISDGPVAVSFPVPHRCRGGITVLIDTSTSVWTQSAAPTMVASIRGFLNALTGSPVRVRLVTFDLSAATLSPASTTGAFTSTLLTSAALTSMHTSVEALDDTSTRWKAGSNWEDALWQAVRLDVGSILPSLPDLVVLVTDGVPTRNRTNLSSDGDNTFQDADLSRAVTAATYARSTGAPLAGILVGTGATPTALSNLQTVIGSDVTSGTFAELSSLLTALVRARCGATVTLVPRLDTAGTLGPATGTWSITVDGAVQSLDASMTAALTIDSASPRSPSAPCRCRASCSNASTVPWPEWRWPVPHRCR